MEMVYFFCRAATWLHGKALYMCVVDKSLSSLPVPWQAAAAVTRQECLPTRGSVMSMVDPLVSDGHQRPLDN